MKKQAKLTGLSYNKDLQQYRLIIESHSYKSPQLMQGRLGRVKVMTDVIVSDSERQYILLTKSQLKSIFGVVVNRWRLIERNQVLAATEEQKSGYSWVMALRGDVEIEVGDEFVQLVHDGKQAVMYL